MAVFLLLLVYLGFVDSSCPNYWTSFEESCYDLIRNPSTWAGASEICRTFQSELMAVETVEESKFLDSFIKNQHIPVDKVWLGGNDLMSEDHWMWENGQPLTFTNWHPGEPNNSGQVENCLEIYQADKWNDDDCSKTNYFICEKPKPTDTVIG